MRFYWQLFFFGRIRKLRQMKNIFVSFIWLINKSTNRLKVKFAQRQKRNAVKVRRTAPLSTLYFIDCKSFRKLPFQNSHMLTLQIIFGRISPRQILRKLNLFNVSRIINSTWCLNIKLESTTTPRNLNWKSPST